MDRSFLSSAPVIEVSRKFVCVRLATYEDPLEAEFTRALVRTRSGELENTAFALFAPDGGTKLSRPSRGTKGLFADAADMAAEMTKIAAKHPGKPVGERPLPTVANVKLAVAVAAADDLPLVAVTATDQTARKAVAALAWSDAFIGRFVYVIVEKPDGLKLLTNTPAAAGLLVAQPETFGRTAQVIAHAPVGAAPDALSAALARGAAAFVRADKSFGTHVRDGQRNGVYYEPPLPVTDPQEKQARERGRQKKQ